MQIMTQSEMNSSTRSKLGRIKQMKKSQILYKKNPTLTISVVQPDKERLDTVSLVLFRYNGKKQKCIFKYVSKDSL